MKCKETKPLVGCWNKSDGSKENITIHYTYGLNAVGNEILSAVRYTSADGTIVILGAGESVSVGSCSIVQKDQTHTLITGSNTAIPAGLKSVTINNITGTTIVAGGYELGNGRRDNSISLNATELSEVRGLLPAITITGGTWQWIGIQPILEE